MKFTPGVKHFYADNLPANPGAVYSCDSDGCRATTRQSPVSGSWVPKNQPFWPPYGTCGRGADCPNRGWHASGPPRRQAAFVASRHRQTCL